MTIPYILIIWVILLLIFLFKKEGGGVFYIFNKMAVMGYFGGWTAVAILVCLAVYLFTGFNILSFGIYI